ncbi:MAG: hypothetical protein AAFW81_11610 [Pseudomonadota bacterium]
MNAPISPVSTTPSGADPAERNQRLADARSQSSESALARAEAAEARRADNRQNAREVLAEVLGVNTRISIERSTAPFSFIYRAIDVDTGEIVREWPPADFAQFLESQGLTAAGLDAAGLTVDESA